MKSVIEIWNALNMRRRVIVVGAAGAMFLAILFMAQIAGRPNMSLLYAELEQDAAGEVVRALGQRNMRYEVRGDSIFVESGERDALRMTLASEGLPANGSKGYELLDALNGFGTTAQMFDAAYWRAKEGELARTIVSLSSVSSARVHIAQADNAPFQRGATPKASVFLTARNGVVEPGQARAMRFLVASAVPGLAPEDVSVVDNQGRLITNEAAAATANIADDKGDSIRDRVQRLVEARVGKGNSVVEVSVDTVTESESILERRFDPDGRVAISTDTEETTNQSENGSAGSVTVASNMPDGDAAGAQGASSQSVESRERVNYEVSETTREITRVPGAIRRLTVAVMVNGTYEIGDDGARQFVPLAEAELTALHDLVASAVGFDEARGDQITIRSMPFDEPVISGSTATIRPWYSAIDLTGLGKLALLSAVALIMGLFVLRPILRAPPPLADTSLLNGPGIPADEIPAISSVVPDVPQIADLPMALPDTESFAFGALDEQPADPVDKLRGLIDTRKDESVEILRGWLSEKETAV
ncbi:flagellar basal-body MS-ring/collar protein FliF [Pseudoprimorskyibacter insulae]|uniref:Flagellar M-ring protein n=1 Tax=Pseudoprimorskyibacter insulae TaxID=1695997 RepID=A0A2R8AYJ9_9RHOB|nr:flagellar basal-body MS-ring/collar protein FliF [Pseudoprimorskyibacter insulae]SPF81106.1 Flagellar M-ring protein [Pseudoprimorskyibacter insulae]